MNSTYNIVGKDNLDVMNLSLNYNRTVYKILRKNLKKNIKILDFGAGSGEFINRFYKDFKDFFDLSAVEIDKDLQTKIKCKVYTTLAELKDQSVDYIYSCNVLEHIQDDKNIVNILREKLLVGGGIFILVPAKMILYSKMDEVIGHFRRYERDELYNLFYENGFKINYCRYFDFAGFFGSYFYNMMNKDFNSKGLIDKKSVVFYDKYLFPISRLFDYLTLGRVIGRNLILSGIKL